jgi:hypothetical protein
MKTAIDPSFNFDPFFSHIKNILYCEMNPTEENYWGDEELFVVPSNSRRKREAAALNFIERYKENIVPLITCTIIIYILVLITLPLLFCGEHTCFSGRQKTNISHDKIIILKKK